MTTRDMGIARPDWLPPALYQQWIDLYIEAGGTGTQGAAEMATEWLRQSPEYDQYFPGIKRDDGSIRYPNFPEATYLNNIESFKRTVASLGINPEVFDEEYVNLISGDTSPQEFNARVENINARVMLAGDAIKDYYATEFGLGMSDQGIIASLMSDRVGDAILQRQITMAEIGGEAAGRNYDLSYEFVESLAEAGMDRGQAQRMFGSADRLLTSLNRMAQRHGDPDDSFDITEFVEGVGLDDAEQLQRMETLQSQEQSLFTGGAQIDVRRDRAGGVAGLAST